MRILLVVSSSRLAGTERHVLELAAGLRADGLDAQVMCEAGGDGLDEALKEYVKQKIGVWKYPRWIDIRPDLPRTATGKIQRFKLRD